jgi:hypothetical protein
MYQPQVIGDGDCGEIGGMKIGRHGKPKYSEKTCPSATLSTTNPTWLDPGSNPGRRGGKPATNRLSYGAATYIHLYTSSVYLSLESAHICDCLKVKSFLKEKITDSEAVNSAATAGRIE